MRIISFDVESCNGNPKEASLCSFGYCISDENYNILEKKDILINPVSKNLTLCDSKRNFGIKLAYGKKEFRSAPLFCELYEEIKKLLQSCDLVLGFSIENDINYLNKACEYYSLENINFRFIDVQELDSLVNGGNQKESLEKAVKKFGVQFTLHKSDDDALATLLLLKNICLTKNTCLEGLLDEYNVVPGENFENGFSHSYSLNRMCEKNGLSSGLKLKKYLFCKYLRKLKRGKGNLNGKTFSFCKKLAYSDINLSRSLLSAIYCQGGKYTMFSNQADLFVITSVSDCNAKEKRLQGQVDIIDLNELYSLLDNFSVKEFDDENSVRNYFKMRVN